MICFYRQHLISREACVPFALKQIKRVNSSDSEKACVIKCPTVLRKKSHPFTLTNLNYVSCRNNSSWIRDSLRSKSGRNLLWAKSVVTVFTWITFGYLFFPADNVNEKYRPTISGSHELHQQQSRRDFFGKPPSGASSSTFH